MSSCLLSIFPSQKFISPQHHHYHPFSFLFFCSKVKKQQRTSIGPKDKITTNPFSFPVHTSTPSPLYFLLKSVHFLIQLFYCNHHITRLLPHEKPATYTQNRPISDNKFYEMTTMTKTFFKQKLHCRIDRSALHPIFIPVFQENRTLFQGMMTTMMGCL